MSDKDDRAIFEKSGEYPSPSALSVQKKVTKAIIELHDVFAKQHHDNFSASYVILVLVVKLVITLLLFGMMVFYSVSLMEIIGLVLKNQVYQ